jgi:uncharacterized damage-inducible protein DinB
MKLCGYHRQVKENATMSERATELANRFTTANDELIGIIQGASDGELQTICPGEQWSVLVTARHVAIAYRVVGSWIRRVANGEDIPVTRRQIDEGNALHAQEFAGTTREEVLTLLRDNGIKAADTIRNLSDEQLDTSAAMGPADGDRITAEQVTQSALIHHITDHTADIRATLAQPGDGGVH